jgi:hypothetical protein
MVGECVCDTVHEVAWLRSENALSIIEDAIDIVDMFFNKILGTSMARLVNMIESILIYNAKYATGTDSYDPETPFAIRWLYSDFTGLAVMTPYNLIFQLLLYNMGVLRLAKDWEHVRSSLSSINREGVQISRFLNLSEPIPGTTRASIAKLAVYIRFEISPTDFSKHLRNA